MITDQSNPRYRSDIQPMDNTTDLALKIKKLATVEEIEAVVKEIRLEAIRYCLHLVEHQIRRGALPGNGVNETAHNNGLICASNVITENLIKLA